MNFSVRLIRLLLVVAAAGLLAGCLPPTTGQLDEEKEPHFLAGKSRANARDFKGAIESFEKSLEGNPRSALAHFELGVLFEQREGDPAAAIYHYERYLKLLPGAGNGDTVKTRILACKQELARTVSLGPVTQPLQAELEKLTEENKRVSEQITRLTEENKRLLEAVEQWRRAYAARAVVPTNAPEGVAGSRLAAPAAVPVSISGSGGGSNRPPSLPSSSAGSASPSRAGVARPSAGSRTHVVKSGETMGLIARQYGVRIEALQAANPGVDARRLRPGRVLRVPGGGN